MKTIIENNMTIVKETEKAVQVVMGLVSETLDKTFKRSIWLPKSQIGTDGDPSSWIIERKVEELELELPMGVNIVEVVLY